MKRLLAISLLLNALLAALIWWRPAGLVIPLRPVRGEVTPRAGDARPGARTLQFVPVDASPSTPWSAIENRDPRQLIANLRAAGCPESTIRDLVFTRLCRAYRGRLLADEAERQQAWDYAHNRSSRDIRAGNRSDARLRDEMKSEVEAVLGQPWGRLLAEVTGWGWVNPDREFLPLEKRRELRALEQNYRDQRLGVDWNAGVLGVDANDLARLKQAQREYESAVAAVLAPAEFAEWKYRESEASRFARQSLPEASSEAEFRQIVDLAQEFDLANHPPSLDYRQSTPPAEEDPGVADYHQRKAAFDEKLKSVLGEERIAEQQAEQHAREERERQIEQERQEQANRDELAGVAAEAGVDAAAAQRFFDRLKELQPQLQARFDEFEKTLTGTPEEKRKQLEAAVMAELERHAVEIIGEKGSDLVRKLKEHGSR